MDDHLTGAVRIRPMAAGDLTAMAASARLSFVDLRRRFGEPVPTEPPLDAAPPRPSPVGEAIVAQLLERDPPGAWVADRDGALVGVAMAGRRDGVWYLAHLHLEPGYQGRGIGRDLLAAALTYAAGTRGMLLHSSLDPQAMRCYQRAGFALEPALDASGRVRRSAVPAGLGVRDGDAGDLDLAATLDRDLRGGAHGVDLELLLRLGARLFVADGGGNGGGGGRGYAVVMQEEPKIVAATDEATARALLWAALAESGPDEVAVHILRGDQQWAVDVAVRAGLAPQSTGPLCRRGAPGPLAPYLPHPALL